MIERRKGWFLPGYEDGMWVGEGGKMGVDMVGSWLGDGQSALAGGAA